MELLILTTVGVLATELSYLPQIILLHKRKKCKSISLSFVVLNILGRICIAITSFHYDPILSVGFITGSVLRIVLICQVLYYRKSKKKKKKKNK